MGEAMVAWPESFEARVDVLLCEPSPPPPQLLLPDDERPPPLEEETASEAAPWSMLWMFLAWELQIWKRSNNSISYNTSFSFYSGK